MTVAAVALGVAFVTGTALLTSTINTALRDALTRSAGGADLVIEAAEEVAGTEDAPRLTDDLVDEVAQISGVAEVDPLVRGVAQLIDQQGEPIAQPIGSAELPAAGENAPAREGLRGLQVRDGAFPSTHGEVAIDVVSAESASFAVGDEVRVVIDGPEQSFRISAIVGYEDLDHLGGSTLALFTPDQARALLTDDDGYGRLNLLLGEDADVDAVRDELVATLDDDVAVRTATEVVDAELAGAGSGLGIIGPALSAFAVIALFVSAFIIANTFAIIVGQRARELALLRAIGTSRRQTFNAVLIEAVAVGLVGGLVGLAGGIGVAASLRALLTAGGVDLPNAPLTIDPSLVLLAPAMGIVVTTISALGPALRATRMPPVAALRADPLPTSPTGLGGWRLAGGLAAAVGGSAAMTAGLLAGGGAVVTGAGALLAFAGVALLAPAVTRPVIGVLGAPLSRSGIVGRLACENSMRNPRRTATTAAALMVGLGLVVVVAIASASLRASFTDLIDEVFVLDYRAEPVTFQGGRETVALSRQLGDDLAGLEQVAAVGAEQIGFFDLDGAAFPMLGLDAANLTRFYEFPPIEGALADLASGGIAISQAQATSRGLAVGDEAAVVTDAGTEATWPVVAVFDGEAFDADFVTDLSTFDAGWDRDQVNRFAIDLADGADPAQAEAALSEVMSSYPTARLLDTSALLDQLIDTVDQLFGLVTVLLGLSVLIAVLGIVNTLALSVLERVREVGLLRAVGMTRRQLTWMLTWESITVAALGAVLGCAIGVGLGWIVVEALGEYGVRRMVLPTGWVIGSFLFAVLAGVVAGIVPARRATRIDTLDALRAT